MEANGVDVFATAADLDAYCAQVTARLRTRWKERSELLASAVDRLQSLRTAAGVIQDTELEQELAVRLEAAQAELRQVDAAAREAQLEAV